MCVFLWLCMCVFVRVNLSTWGVCVFLFAVCLCGVCVIVCADVSVWMCVWLGGLVVCACALSVCVSVWCV